MRTGTEMKVRLADLPSRQQITLPTAFVRDAIASLEIRAALERPADDPDAGEAEADIELRIDEDNVFGRGHMGGWVMVACGRCVGPVRIAIDEDLAITFLPREQVPEDDDEEEVEVTEDDVDLYPYDDEEIDLEPLLREQLIMAVPYAPLCTDACKGLCTVCGVDLNRTSCGCDTGVVDPRLASLKDLKV